MAEEATKYVAFSIARFYAAAVDDATWNNQLLINFVERVPQVKAANVAIYAIWARSPTRQQFISTLDSELQHVGQFRVGYKSMDYINVLLKLFALYERATEIVPEDKLMQHFNDNILGITEMDNHLSARHELEEIARDEDRGVLEAFDLICEPIDELLKLNGGAAVNFNRRT